MLASNERNLVRFFRIKVGLQCLLLLVLLCSCSREIKVPSIQITTIPPADKGGDTTHDRISGRTNGASSAHQVVLYARSGAW